MSENSSEYLKRTCLICGCHTNQTINIYEPRSGPNIVQLIQAKFKFQPLNEDKYLCFSCNNWLINWHSLQALNSNEADSSSGGTFRASLNSGDNSVMQTKLKTDDDNNVKRPVAICRPIRQVPTTSHKESIIGEEEHNTTIISNIQHKLKNSKPKSKLTFKKPQLRLRRLRHRTYSTQLRLRCSCGRALLLLASEKRKLNNKSLKRKVVGVVKCFKCKANDYMKSSKSQNLVNNALQARHQQDDSKSTESHKTYLRKPLVDGKVIAMLRRIGTTLSRESIIKSNNDHKSMMVQQQQLPQIMSPTKAKQRWSRPLADDEIVLNFEATVTEVLPAALTTQISNDSNNTNKLRKRLTYQMSLQEGNCIDLKTNEEFKAEGDDDVNMPKTEMTLPLNLPKGLSITLV
uniref:ZAD domain-containing protein n=1 Tax=Glossina pallidipes TaxID=7398 RepID=A0A1B0A7E5_GLOPL